jgi:general stress protein CsbA
MVINNYYIKARLFPTVLTTLPAIILYNKYVASIYYNKLASIYSALPTVTDVILSTAIVFLLVQINRFLSKEIFQRLYFKDEINMPTTNLLLKSNGELETSIKQKIEDKIKTKFNISLLSSIEESADQPKARKLIVTTVSQIRNILRDNSLLLQHNIEYGFFRNLIGGSFLAFMLSIIILFLSFYSGEIATRNLGIILTSLYFFPILLSKFIINRYGRYYAKILYEQFLTT